MADVRVTFIVLKEDQSVFKRFLARLKFRRDVTSLRAEDCFAGALSLNVPTNIYFSRAFRSKRPNNITFALICAFSELSAQTAAPPCLLFKYGKHSSSTAQCLRSSSNTYIFPFNIPFSLLLKITLTFKVKEKGKEGRAGGEGHEEIK